MQSLEKELGPEYYPLRGNEDESTLYMQCCPPTPLEWKPKTNAGQIFISEFVQHYTYFITSGQPTVRSTMINPIRVHPDPDFSLLTYTKFILLIPGVENHPIYRIRY